MMFEDNSEEVIDDLASSATTIKIDETSAEITESVNQESMSTSALLYYCKCKILHPYSRLLCIMGLRPPSVEESEHYVTFCGFSHMILVLTLMCVGYILQYMTCFRRERGFDYKNDTTVDVKGYDQVCYGNTVFSYIVPSLLHLSAYVYALYLFRINENEQLENLIERALLISGGSSTQHKIVHTLWISIGLSILWMISSVVIISIMMTGGLIVFHWLQHSSIGVIIFLKILLVLSTLWHDMVQATLITSYCLQSQILSLHVQSLKAKLLQHNLYPGDWMRAVFKFSEKICVYLNGHEELEQNTVPEKLIKHAEICEFQKLLKYLNEDLAPIICILSVINISFATSGTVWLLKLDPVDTETKPISIVSIFNVVLWMLIAVVPFIQASRLTAACVAVRDVGQEVRTRPFVYETTPGQDLDTILLFTSSLRMTSKLFNVPVTGRYLCITVTIVTILIITLGQCHRL